MNARDLSIAPPAAGARREPLWLALVAVAGLMAIGALVKLPLPFSPVPVTLQTFTALVAAYLVGPRRATAGIAVYTVLGMLGTPLFAVTSGATAGYLAAFIAAPCIVTWFRHPLAGMTAAMACIYVLGAGWLVLGLGMTLPQAVALGIVPFLPGDLLKLSAAYGVARRLPPPESAG
jgi:biotin transport system substrate-specific component